jgi:hypothetical protein
MLDILGGGVIGSIFGGLFRLAPEVLKLFDKKNERQHELAMFQLQTDLEKVRGEFKVEEKYASYSVEQLKALQEAFKEQGKTAAASYKWVSAASALVRPTITYVLFGLYVAVKIIIITYAINSGTSWYEVATLNWTPEDFAMLNMILTFHFLGRPIEKYRQ